MTTVAEKTPAIKLGTPYKETGSERNTKLVLEAVKERFPEWANQCEPYRNVLTVKAWNQRGYRVKKGEKAIKVFTQVPVVKKDDDGEEVVNGHRMARANVFALPQVERV